MALQYSEIDWNRAEAAIEFLESLDVVDLASRIVSETRDRGAKEAYNIAGNVRYELEQAAKRREYLEATICKYDLATIDERIETLERRNALKRKFLAAAE